MIKSKTEKVKVTLDAVAQDELLAECKKRVQSEAFYMKRYLVKKQ